MVCFNAPCGCFCFARRRHSCDAIFTMRIENACERGVWILQIEIMGAFFGVRLNLLRSAFGVMARDAKVLNSTKVSQSSRRFGGELNGASRSKRPIHPSGIILSEKTFFVQTFLTNKFETIYKKITQSSDRLSATSRQANFLAFYHSYQGRFDYWMAGNAPDLSY